MRSMSVNVPGVGRRIAVGGMAMLLAVVLAMVATRDTRPGNLSLEEQARTVAATPLLKDRAPKLSFAQWYQQQSAAAWFGDDTMPQKVTVGHQNFAEQGEKTNWLSKQDMKGIPTVLQAEHANKLKKEEVQLAMARLAEKHQNGNLAHALKQQLAGYGDIAELNKLVPKEPASLPKARAVDKLVTPVVKGAKMQELLRMTQKLGETDAEQIYRPVPSEGDGADLPEERILSIVEGLDTKFLNRSTASFQQNEKHHLGKTPEVMAEEKAAEAAQKKAEHDAEAIMAHTAAKLQNMLNMQMQLKTEQADRLSQLTKTLHDVLSPQGYSSAVITQCGDHCAEVQIAAQHQASLLRQQQRDAQSQHDHDKAQEDRELKMASRR